MHVIKGIAPLIAFDGESSGLNNGQFVVGKPSQAFEFSFALLHPDTWEIEDMIYQRCQHNPEKYDWDHAGIKIHGTALTDLTHEPSMAEAGESIFKWIHERMPVKENKLLFQTLCHNGHNTDLVWLEHWFHAAGKMRGQDWNYHHRALDAYNICALNLGLQNSQHQFVLMNHPRTTHSSLEDVLVMVHACRLAGFNLMMSHADCDSSKLKDIIRYHYQVDPVFATALEEEKNLLAADIQKWSYLAS